MKKSRLLGAVGFVLFSTTVNASLVTLDWKTPGDEFITYDTESGFDWLNITVTQGLSKSYVLSELGTGGMFEGFRYPEDSGYEFFTLMEHAGFDLNTPFAPTGVAPYFHSLLGCTASGTDVCSSDGMFDSSGSPTNYAHVMTIVHSTSNPSTDQWFDSIGILEAPPISSLYEDGHPDVGSYLLRAHVPIPPALWLFGSGLLGLVGIFRRKKMA